MMPYTSAEIPPAGAPSGFDYAAMIGFRARRCTGGAAPLRMTQRVWRIVRYNPFVAMLL